MDSAGPARAAVRVDNSADTLSRTTDLPATASFTMMAWVRLVVDTNSFSAIFHYGRNDTTADDEEMWLQTNTDGTTLNLDVPGASIVLGSALTVGTWYHLAVVKSGTAYTAYLNGTSDITATGNAPTSARLDVMNDQWVEQLNGRMCAVKIYEAALTQAEILNEMRSYRPKRTANLYGWWPMLSAGDGAVDYSGNGRDWTVGGTLTTEDGPPVSWK